MKDSKNLSAGSLGILGLDLVNDSVDIADSKDVMELRRKYDISLKDAKEIINILGYKNASSYSNWFFSSTLEDKYYLLGAKKVAEGFVKVSELKFSLIESIIKDSIKTFGITEQQLRQGQYIRTSALTGTRISGDSPYSSGHSIEHEFSRIDRLED